MQNFKELIEKLLILGQQTIQNNPLLGEDVGTINVKGDKTIGMDKKMEEELIKFIQDSNLAADIFSEEIGVVKYHNNPEYLITFDPLDGSTNYKIGKNILPYGLMVAIYKGTEPKLKDIIASGAIEFTSNKYWIYSDGITVDYKGERVEISKKWEITKSTPVYLDLYYKEGYDNYAGLPGKVFIRNCGSTIGNLSLVLSEVATTLGGICMRPEEIGTVYSLIKGAGGIAVNHKNEDLGEQVFDINKTYQILAGNKEVVEFVIKNIH